MGAIQQHGMLSVKLANCCQEPYLCLSDMKGDMALQILPYLLPGSSYKVAKNSMRPTVDEAEAYFIDKKPVSIKL